MVGEESISLEEGRRFGHIDCNDDDDDDDEENDHINCIANDDDEEEEENDDDDNNDDDGDSKGNISQNDSDFQTTFVTRHPWIALNR